MKVGEWDAHYAKSHEYFKASGALIHCWTHASSYEEAAPIIRALSQSLMFFGDGCREENDIMAIVKFSACLEAISGGKERAILDLIGRLIGKEPHDQLTDRLTYQQAMKRIYGKARSRTLHGTNDEIIHDWVEDRMLAELLARECYIRAMDWHLNHPEAGRVGQIGHQ